MANQITKWLERYAQEVEKKTIRKLHCRIGDYKGEYYENGEYIPIQGGLFLTTNNGNLFTVYDREKYITDCFDVFESNASVKIDEKFFTYIIKRNNTENDVYTISLAQIKTDIKMLNNKFTAFGGAWEHEDGSPYGCTPIAEQELALVKGIASRYPFKYEYDPSEFDKNPYDLREDWSDIKFDIDDFNKNNINTDNYEKVDAVASDFKEELIGMLSKLKEELEWLPPRFRYEFLSEVICTCEQDRHSVRKNSEYFAETIDDELTKEERSKMFITLG